MCIRDSVRIARVVAKIVVPVEAREGALVFGAALKINTSLDGVSVPDLRHVIADVDVGVNRVKRRAVGPKSRTRGNFGPVERDLRNEVALHRVWIQNRQINPRGGAA